MLPLFDRPNIYPNDIHQIWGPVKLGWFKSTVSSNKRACIVSIANLFHTYVPPNFSDLPYSAAIAVEHWKTFVIDGNVGKKWTKVSFGKNMSLFLNLLWMLFGPWPRRKLLF